MDRPEERSAKEVASKLSWIINLEKKFPELAGNLDLVGAVVEVAIQIDPNDPPAALKRAQANLQKENEYRSSASP